MDEVFDGGRCTFFATDPLNDRTIDFHCSDTRDANELRTFLEKLKGMGIMPEVFLSDGAPVYENIPMEVFGGHLKHQICTFHFVRDCMKDVMDFVRYFKKSYPKNLKKGIKRTIQRGIRFNWKNQKIET